MSETTFREVFEEFENQEKLDRNEGRTGVKNLCRVVNAIGYQDRLHFGAFSQNSSVGDLIEFLEDNPGCIEAIKEWIIDQNVEWWRDNLLAFLPIGALSGEKEEGEDE
jgi:hypothetical protein